jgi:L-ascorbate metabolism protein UlaG (beta-lactamase superfamily)
MADGALTARGEGASADRIVFLGHATALIEVAGVRLLSDPLLRGRVAHLRRQVAPVDAAMTERVDAVLISHFHHDHLDPASLRSLGLDARLIVPAGAGTWLRRRGFADVTELDVGEHTGVGALTVYAVPADHDRRRSPGGPSAAALGFLIDGPRAIYFAGDTALFDGMGDLHPRLDVALLPVAGWGPTLGPGHMGPLQAARACALLHPRLAIPVHWGTLLPIGLARRHAAALGEPPRLFAEHVARLAPDVEVVVLAPGEQTTL